MLEEDKGSNADLVKEELGNDHVDGVEEGGDDGHQPCQSTSAFLGRRWIAKECFQITHRPFWIPSRFYEVKECRENGDWNETKDGRKEEEEEGGRKMRRHFQFFT